MNTKHKTCFRNSPNDLEGPALLTSMVLRVQQLCLLAALLNWKIAIHMACMCAFITISIILISMSYYGTETVQVTLRMRTPASSP